MRPRQFDLIAFDWDGTLFDSTAISTRCIQAAVADVGIAVPTDQAARQDASGLSPTRRAPHARSRARVHTGPRS